MSTIVGRNARGGIAKVASNTKSGYSYTAPSGEKKTYTKPSSDLATQNGITSSISTPAPANESITDTYNRAVGVSNSDPAGIRGGNTTPIATTPPPTTRPNRPINTPAVAAPQTAAQIQSDLLKASQGEINAINQYASQQIEALKPTQDARVRETAGVNTLTGLAGSSEANVTAGATRATNDKENALVRAEAASKIQSVMSGVKTKALEMAQTAKEQFRLDTAESRAKKLADATEAVQHAATLAASGVTYDGLKATDPVSYQHLADSVGGEEMLKAQFTLNRPQEDILDKKIENGKYVIAYRNPLTGATRIESVDLGLPPQYTKTVDAGNRILAIPDNWDGNPQNLITINKGLTPSQQQSNSPSSPSNQYTNDLDAIVGATEAIIPSKFGQETFRKQMARTRNEADKISLVASVVLGKADAATKTDFTNQAVGIKQIDKAIKMLDDGAETGVFEAGAQYAFNVVGKDFDPKLAQINQLLTSAIQPYRNSVTGAAWGNQEDGEYQMLFGSTKYAPEELRQRLVGVKDILASKSATALGSYVNPMGTYGDPFASGNYSAADTGEIEVRALDGTIGTIPAEQLEEALNAGYTKI